MYDSQGCKAQKDDGVMMQERGAFLAFLAYQVVGIFTFVYLTLFDGYVYNAWNWIVAVPVNAFLAEIWPLYWGILRWLG